MTDKVQKIREEVERLKLCTMDEHMKFYSEAAEAEYNALCNIEHFIDSLQEEPVSDDLEEASKEWLKPQLDKSYANYGEAKMMELTRFDGYAMLDAIEFGAKWQEKQDQSTIELAEDHAMLAGMEKMKEQMMKTVIETEVVDDSFGQQVGEVPAIRYDVQPEDNLEIGDKVKLIIIKED